MAVPGETHFLAQVEEHRGNSKKTTRSGQGPQHINGFYTSIREHQWIREAPVAWQPPPPRRIRGAEKTSGVALVVVRLRERWGCCGIGVGWSGFFAAIGSVPLATSLSALG